MREGRLDPFWDGILYSILRGVFGWTTLLALCGFAMHHLNRRGPLLEYLNVAILPVYVLHQPILLIAAFWIFPLQLPIAFEASALLGVTAFGALLLYELCIRRFALVRFLFGLRPAGR